MDKVEIGIIGGSGLYAMPGLSGLQEVAIETPFGAPSDAYMVGELDGRKVAFLARHGRGHRITPTELNFRANIWGMKKLGVEYILSVSAVGSLKEEHKPTDFVIPDQFIDRTFARVSRRFLARDCSGARGIWRPGLLERWRRAFETCMCKELGVVGKRGRDIRVHGGAAVLDEG